MSFAERLQRLFVLANRAKNVIPTEFELANSIFALLLSLFDEDNFTGAYRNNRAFEGYKEHLDTILFEYQDNGLVYKDGPFLSNYYDLAVFELGENRLSIPVPLLSCESALFFLKKAGRNDRHEERHQNHDNDRELIDVLETVDELWEELFKIVPPAIIIMVVGEYLNLDDAALAKIKERCDKYNK